MAQTQSRTNTGSDGDYIFKGPAEFNTNQVIIDVRPETGIAEFFLNDCCQRGIFGSNSQGRGIALGNLLGKRWPAQGRNFGSEAGKTRDNLVDYFAHAQQRIVLDSFGCT